MLIRETVALRHPSCLGVEHRATLLRSFSRKVRQQEPTYLHQGLR